MSAIDELFRRLRTIGRPAFVAFVPAGDPDLQFTEDLLHRFARLGVDLCELGIPYSDPIADGPVIQAAYTRALAKGIKVQEVFDLVGRIAGRLNFPIALMTSYSIVFRRGLEDFVRQCARTGVAGLIVPDLPIEEAAPLGEVCRSFDLSLIPLVTPTTPPDRARRIAAQASGFIYYVSVTGITGERDQLPEELVQKLSWLRSQTDLPVCVGFGISRPEHIATLAPIADGVIVGSAIVRRIAEAQSKPREQVLEETCQFVDSLLRPIRGKNPTFP
ncbi:MAG: tryptophan synthase subunit alpha [Thermoguttaceae bacterium]|nr:tryptophan synthase subunit alpha [Thermoguttaceae bacterium]MDW8079911.1 tryptophan synthase subunit alpha [Thermoguttaceae bacterium]